MGYLGMSDTARGDGRSSSEATWARGVPRAHSTGQEIFKAMLGGGIADGQLAGHARYRRSLFARSASSLWESDLNETVRDTADT
jgi:hypothetical protein